jgi:hypothetical protein
LSNLKQLDNIHKECPYIQANMKCKKAFAMEGLMVFLHLFLEKCHLDIKQAKKNTLKP